MSRAEGLHALWAEVLRLRDAGLLDPRDGEVLVELLSSLAVIALREEGEAPVPPDLSAAARLQAAWEAGRCCSLVGRGMRARVLRAGRLVQAGLMLPEEAERVAAEAENVALGFAPLPVPPDDVHDR